MPHLRDLKCQEELFCIQNAPVLQESFLSISEDFSVNQIPSCLSLLVRSRKNFVVLSKSNTILHFDGFFLRSGASILDSLFNNFYAVFIFEKDRVVCSQSVFLFIQALSSLLLSQNTFL